MRRLARRRRPAGYLVASPDSRTIDDPGEFHEIELVNRIRPRVKAWREAGYPGATGITRRLLEYWNDPSERDDRRFFICQLEAAETLIWLAEAPDSEKVGIEIPDGEGEFHRICCKMATGSGKTVVMAMLIAWQVLNKATYPQDPRYSKNIFIVAPGLPVRSRLQVLLPDDPGNYYDAFAVVPSGLRETLRQGRVLVETWHTLAWETAEKLAKKRSVDRRGPKSNEAYVRSVLGELARANNIVVINDEAHHAWRVPPDAKVRASGRARRGNGLDSGPRPHPRGAKHPLLLRLRPPVRTDRQEEHRGEPLRLDCLRLQPNDAIESGLVKTPYRHPRRQRSKGLQVRLYHIYRDRGQDNLNRKAEEHGLPSLVVNAYYLLARLGGDLRPMGDGGSPVPQV